MNTNLNPILSETTNQRDDSLFGSKMIYPDQEWPLWNFPEVAAKLTFIECFIFINDLEEKSKQH